MNNVQKITENGQALLTSDASVFDLTRIPRAYGTFQDRRCNTAYSQCRLFEASNCPGAEHYWPLCIQFDHHIWLSFVNI